VAITDLDPEMYAQIVAELSELGAYNHPSRGQAKRIAELNYAREVWRSLAETFSDIPYESQLLEKKSQTAFWQFIDRLDRAGENAPSLIHECPDIWSILNKDVAEESPPQPSYKQTSTDDTTVSHRKNLRKFMKTFQVVETVNLTSKGKEYIPFDMLDTNNPRSVYQELAYGEFVDELQDGRNPGRELVYNPEYDLYEVKSPGTPFYEVRTKPRQVGSTEFWKQISCAMMQLYPGYRVMLHFPLENDAQEHLIKVSYQLERMATLWPDKFFPITRRSMSDGIIQLANGSEAIIRYAGGTGLARLGGNFNMVIMSEAGKYEKVKPGIWGTINQVVIPAVHGAQYNVVAWEGTNDEMAKELQRLEKLSHQPHSPYRFRFFGWTYISTYVGPEIRSPETSASGRYSDWIMVDGDRRSISEESYAEMYSLTPAQIGFRRQKIDSLGDLELFHREYPMTYEESCTAAYGRFFGPKVLTGKYPEPLRKINLHSDNINSCDYYRSVEVQVEETSDALWHIWEEPKNDMEYSLSGDFSDGIPGGDYTYLTVFDIWGTQVAAAKFRGGPQNDIIIAQQMVMICRFYKDKPYVIGELNNVGKAVRSRWLDFGYPRNYRRILERKSYDEDTDSIWFVTSQANRGPIVLRLRTAMSKGEMQIRDSRFQVDAHDFVKHKNAKYAHSESVSVHTGERAHDDTIIGCALAYEMNRIHPMRGKFFKNAKVDRPRVRAQAVCVEDGTTYNELFGGILRKSRRKSW